MKKRDAIWLLEFIIHGLSRDCTGTRSCCQNNDGAEQELEGLPEREISREIFLSRPLPSCFTSSRQCVFILLETSAVRLYSGPVMLGHIHKKTIADMRVQHPTTAVEMTHSSGGKPVLFRGLQGHQNTRPERP